MESQREISKLRGVLKGQFKYHPHFPKCVGSPKKCVRYCGHVIFNFYVQIVSRIVKDLEMTLVENRTYLKFTKYHLHG